MANTRVHHEAEAWVRTKWMPEQFGCAFTEKPMKLTSGGLFKFDAVDADGQMIASISTSAPKTAGGKPGSGKMHKLRADILFLLLTEAQRRMLILTEQDMYERCLKEKAAGRVPGSIEFFHAPLPDDLVRRIRASREAASKEVSPA
jgi:hypothetical protein